MIGESSVNAEAVFMNKMLDQMDVLNTKRDPLEVNNVKHRENFTEISKYIIFYCKY